MSNAPSLVSPRIPAGDQGHAKDLGHAHDHGHGTEHVHIHAPAAGNTRRASVPPSLLRASLLQRLAVALPVAIVIWVLALWVIYGGAS
jgi:hypothetical protein